MSGFLQLLNLLSFPLLFIFLFLFLTKWIFKTPNSTKNLPPSPPGLPIIGNFHQIGRLAHRSLHSLAAKHGPILLLHLGSVPTLVISSAEAACQIMKNSDLAFANRPKSKVFEKLQYDYKSISVAPYGEFWRQLKSIYVLHLLSNKRVQSFHFVREEEIAHLVNKIEESSSLSLPVNLSEMFASLTNDVISRAAFGRKYGEGENGKKFKQLMTDRLQLLGGFKVGDLFPWLAWISRINGFDAEVERVAEELDEFLEGLVEERINGWSKNGGKVEDESREDFLDILLKIHRENSAGVSIDRDCVKANILVIWLSLSLTLVLCVFTILIGILGHCLEPKKKKKL